MNKKTCNYCNHEKPLSDFAKSKSSKDGRVSTCKKCYTYKYPKRTRRPPPNYISPNPDLYDPEKHNWYYRF